MIYDLIKWSKKEFSHLPWRKNRTLYTTLVSEIMLQQTTVSTVINHYERFLQIYPTLDELANSTEEDLTIQWKGLGYYRRARNLHKACKYFQEMYNSTIPLNYEQLIKAPGIGDYTANAILGIGADKSVICIDANLERVLSRLYNIKMPKGPKLIKTLLEKFNKKEIATDVFKVGGNDYNEALMDLGRVYCQANRVDCMICPMNDSCLSFKKSDPLEIPIRIKKEKKKFYDLKLLRLIVYKDEKILTYKKSSSEWLAGQREIPSFIIESEDKSLKQYPFLKKNIEYELLPVIKTGITKYRIQNFVIICNEDEFFEITGKKVHNYELIEPTQKSNLSTTSLKCLKSL